MYRYDGDQVNRVFDMNYPKVIANYLPQYHCIPENDSWWGQGYTDWVATKAALPQFGGHNQPRVPLNGEYYSLDKLSDIQWQANLAKEYGVYGFGIYHYWFNDHMCLLGKPAEILLQNPQIDIHFLFLWDNCSWKRSWDNLSDGNDWAPAFDTDDKNAPQSSGILAELEYGDSTSWRKHFEYLVDFFRDSRYIKINGRPVFGFMRTNSQFGLISQIASYWNDLAIEAGFRGMYCMNSDTFLSRLLRHKLTGQFRYTPFVTQGLGYWLRNKFNSVWSGETSLKYYDYDLEWSYILRSAQSASNDVFLSGFVDFDDTPRRGSNARIVMGSTPEKFSNYFHKLVEISAQRNIDYVFLSAWNEWGEGMYLEPDTTNGTGYLEALKRALDR